MERKLYRLFKAAMSYSNSRTLEEFIGQAQWVKISQNAFNRFNK
jgi:hypothetical protein